MTPLNPVLVQTIDMTASLAPVIFSMALAALVCGAVLAVLAYQALRAGRTGTPMSGAAEPSVALARHFRLLKRSPRWVYRRHPEPAGHA